VKITSNKALVLLLAGLMSLSGSPVLRSEEAIPAPVPLQSETVTDIPSPPDTTITAKPAITLDSLETAKPQIDSLLYVADSIAYNYDTEQIYLFGDTSIQYRTSTIQADSLQVDLKNERAFSNGRTVLIDKDQVLIGNQVYYDVNSQTGMMFNTSSKLDKGFYYGDEVRKIDDDVYDIDGGNFTTCDDPSPDFWFWSRQMRLYRNDKIVGKPVIAYVNHMPIFYFPFVTFSIKRGRQPGFLIPEPGYNTVDGKYIRNIAFFYPWKDYADATLSFDLNEKTGWKANLENRYTKRYFFNGSFNSSLQRYISNGTSTTDYSIRGNHHHELGNKATFDVNIDYISNKRIWQSSTDINEFLAQRVTSSMSYRKPILSSYLNAGVSYSEDLINNTVSVSLPTVSYSLPTRPVYELFTKKDNATPKTSWWTNFNYSYNVRMDHTGLIKDKNRTLEDLIWDNSYDTTGVVFINEHHLGVKHNFGLNYNYKALGWLNLTQGFNYNEAWMDRDRNDAQWVRGNDYSASTSANFTVYGIANIPNFYVSTLRHILTPSASFSYSPGFPDNEKFYYFGGIGLNSGEKTRTISLGLDQRWQIKLRKTDKQKERKLNDILSWTTRTGINLEAEEKKFTNLAHNISFKPGALNIGKVNLAYNASYNLSQNPYDLHWLNWKTQNQYFSHSLTLSGNALYTDYFPRQKNETFSSYLAPPDTLGNRSEVPSGTGSEASWTLNLSQDMNSLRNIIHPKNNNLRLNASVKVTTNWSLVYSNYYNVTDSKMLSQSFDISRSLHCWKLNVSYTRRSSYWDYRIVFFNTELPDALKFQTRDNKRF
jgi:lipopolysaccharide assembly outer membrane protein LptD (OstA)